MSDAGRAGAILDRYRAEVLRWNRRINLVSRRRPAGVLDGLIRQCREGYALLQRSPEAGLPARAPAHGETPNPMLYLDLGSGAGLPGFVWHALLAEDAVAVETVLVEPRDKRAWFLTRLPAATGAPPLTVHQGRWGQVQWDRTQRSQALPAAWPDTTLITLKALHLTDDEVLAGLVAFFAPAGSPAPGRAPGGRVVIVRFVPPATDVTAEPPARVGTAPAGETVVVSGLAFRGGGGIILSAPRLRVCGADLALATYTRLP